MPAVLKEKNNTFYPIRRPEPNYSWNLGETRRSTSTVRTEAGPSIGGATRWSMRPTTDPSLLTDAHPNPRRSRSNIVP